MTLHLSAFLFLLLLLAFSMARQADERSKFLYLHLPQASGIVFDYQHHMHAPHFVLEERTELHANFAEHIAQANVTETDIRPFFLRNEYPVGRLVEYYSPWCGACQQFVGRYVRTAKDIVSRLPPFYLEFYAVSCSEHHHLCQQEGIRYYPTLRAYKPYSSEYTELESFTIQSVGEALELDLRQISVVDADGSAIFGQSQSDTPSLEIGEGAKMLDILGASTTSYRHTRNDVFRDAALSLTYALENHIHKEDQDRLLPEQAAALSEWLDLLYWALPQNWIVHTLIYDLRRNFDMIVESKSAYMNIVRAHHQVVHDNKKDLQWSQGCRNGEGVVDSFSCGLWYLFHIVSVGVPERHKAVLGHRHRVSTQHAAETLIGYIDNFFGWCPHCREQTLDLYKSCAFNSCRRFRVRHSDPKNRPPEHTWKEFPLWLWEVHNEINKRIVIVEARTLGRKPTRSEIESSRWPPVGACPSCYKANGRWSTPRIYKYLQEEYWPAGVTNFRWVVLDRKDSDYRANYSALRWIIDYVLDVLYPVIFMTRREFIIAGAALICSVASYFGLAATRRHLRIRNMRRTGRHKKFDVDPLLKDS
jgi:thiol-disulfide isomerase/thioredoxin